VSALRSSTTAKHDGPGGTSSLVINVPAGVTDGDLLVAALCVGTATSTTASITGWSSDSVVMSPCAHFMYIFNRIASSEPASYTINLASAKQAIAAVMVAWDHSKLTPAPAVRGTADNKDDDNTTDLWTSSRANALGVIATARIYANNRAGQSIMVMPTWTRIEDEFAYGDAGAGPGENAFEAHVAMHEVYDSDDFAAQTWTADGGNPSIAGWLQYFFGVGEVTTNITASAGGGTQVERQVKLPRVAWRDFPNRIKKELVDGL